MSGKPYKPMDIRHSQVSSSLDMDHWSQLMDWWSQLWMEAAGMSHWCAASCWQGELVYSPGVPGGGVIVTDVQWYMDLLPVLQKEKHELSELANRGRFKAMDPKVPIFSVDNIQTLWRSVASPLQVGLLAGGFLILITKYSLWTAFLYTDLQICWP